MPSPSSPARLAALAAIALLASCSDGATAGTTTSGRVETDPATTAMATTTAATSASSTASAPATTGTPAPSTTAGPLAWEIEAFPVPAGTHPHDVAPAADGGVWYTAQHTGALGHLDPDTGEISEIPLGAGSAPHGVIVDDEGTPWITDGGLNAIVSVDPADGEVSVYPLPDDRGDANLNTAVFDTDGVLWFTGQNGVYGRLDPATGDMEVFDAPRGTGPYGITATPSGDIFYASLAGSYLGRILPDGSAEVLEPPTVGQGARRAWSDSTGAVWVSEWNSGQVSRYDPATDTWDTWDLPGEAATYAVFVDDTDAVWLSDFAANALVRFDPATETFTTVPLPHEPGDVRQIHGRPGEVWGAESSADHLVEVRPS